MNNYPLLLACYRSGQISERQWTEHLSDPLFALWLGTLKKGTTNVR